MLCIYTAIYTCLAHPSKSGGGGKFFFGVGTVCATGASATHDQPFDAFVCVLRRVGKIDTDMVKRELKKKWKNEEEVRQGIALGTEGCVEG